MYFDPLWLVFVIPGIILGLWAQAKVHSAYGRASQIRSRRGITGRSTALAILEAEGVQGVEVEPTHGFLSDHYHPVARKLRLSQQNYESDSLAAVGVAAHEVGHAIQHARRYAPLMIRSALVPLTTTGQWIAQLAMIGGFILMMFSPALGRTFLLWSIIGYAVVFLFTVVTLPVEFNASKRALRVLASNGLVYEDELPEVKRVLDAAALTYVAAAVAVLGTLLHLISIFLRTSDE